MDGNIVVSVHDYEGGIVLKKKKLHIILIVSLVIGVLIFLLANTRMIKWEYDTIYIPRRPIAYDELNKRPEDLIFVYSENEWFRDYLSRGQVRQISKYMKKNNLLIASGSYTFHLLAEGEELLRCFDYLDADTLEPVEFSP